MTTQRYDKPRRARPKRQLAEAVQPDEVRKVDQRLALLGRGLGAMRLAVGEGLMAIGRAGGWEVLGFPSLESYAREALGRCGRWAADIRALTRRLENLPILKAVLRRGELSWSMVELVARVATPDDEATWLADARKATVRQMRVRVSEVRATAAADDDIVQASRVTIMTTVDKVDAWAFERARLMVESVGATRGDGAIEAMLAEALTEIIAQHPEVELPEGIGGVFDADANAWKEELARMRDEGEAVCELGIEVEPVTIETPEIVWPEDASNIDQKLRELARDIAWRDLELAHLGRRCFEAEMWRKLGYASFEQYCRERIGLSASSVHGRVALARRVGDLPDIEVAVAQGRIGYEAAALVSRVADTKTVDAWLARASELTVKQLREEIDCVAMHARVEGRRPEGYAPPDAEMMADAIMLEREVIAVVSGQERQAVEPCADVRDDETPELTTTTLLLSVSEETARFWRALERVHARLWLPGSFVAFLVCAVMKAWSGAVPKPVAYADVYLRDRWKCASPVCTSKNVTPHHILFKSQGGGDERSNLISLCERCHLDLVHGGHLTVVGNAELGLTWRASGWTSGLARENA